MIPEMFRHFVIKIDIIGLDYFLLELGYSAQSKKVSLICFSKNALKVLSEQDVDFSY